MKLLNYYRYYAMNVMQLLLITGPFVSKYVIMCRLCQSFVCNTDVLYF